jgi:ubiquinone/menaquinone biosynthesis C-methylase UbiE
MPIAGLAIISEFCVSRRIEDVLTSYGAKSGGIKSFISKLVAAGIIIEESSPRLSGDRDSAQLCRQFVEPLADAVYRIAGDLMALSPSGLRLFNKRHRYSVSAALQEICADVRRLEANLLQIRRTAQLPTLVQDVCGLRLNIGARNTRIPGWTNVDVYPADVACNISRGLPFENGSASYVFMAHVLEHFFYPEEALDVLREVRRVLKAGGALRVVVPDIRAYVLAYATKNRSFFDDKNTYVGRPNSEQTMLEQLLIYAGVGPAPRYLISSHKFGYDFETLKKSLLGAGFSSVTKSGYMGSTVPELRVDAASFVAGAQSDGVHCSLFVDAWV